MRVCVCVCESFKKKDAGFGALGFGEGRKESWLSGATAAARLSGWDERWDVHDARPPPQVDFCGGFEFASLGIRVVCFYSFYSFFSLFSFFFFFFSSLFFLGGGGGTFHFIVL